MAIKFREAQLLLDGEVIGSGDRDLELVVIREFRIRILLNQGHGNNYILSIVSNIHDLSARSKRILNMSYAIHLFWYSWYSLKVPIPLTRTCLASPISALESLLYSGPAT